MILFLQKKDYERIKVVEKDHYTYLLYVYQFNFGYKH